MKPDSHDKNGLVHVLKGSSPICIECGVNTRPTARLKTAPSLPAELVSGAVLLFMYLLVGVIFVAREKS